MIQPVRVRASGCGGVYASMEVTACRRSHRTNGPLGRRPTYIGPGHAFPVAPFGSWFVGCLYMDLTGLSGRGEALRQVSPSHIPYKMVAYSWSMRSHARSFLLIVTGLAMGDPSAAVKASASVTLPLFPAERPSAAAVLEWVEDARPLLPADQRAL